MIDKLPFIETKAPSKVTLSGEFAHLKPGHPKILDGQTAENGITYLDDFEGTRSYIDLKIPVANWSLASTPQGDSKFDLFPEAQLFDSLDYGKNRAKISWFSVDPLFTRIQGGNANSAMPDHLVGDKEELSNIYVREILETEVFENKESSYGMNNIITTINTFFIKNRFHHTFQFFT